nr:uncharacterized protein LOC127294567 isoform X2 [Lolium perenne]
MAKTRATSRFPPNTASHMLTLPVQIPMLSSGLQCKLFPAPHHHPVRMITMRTQLAPALLLLLVLLAAAAPLVPALTPQEIRHRRLNGANKLYVMSADPAAYAGEKTSAPESKEAAPKDAVQKTSYVMGAGVEPKPESKSDEKVLEAKINAEVKQMRKEAAHDDAVAEKKAKEFKSKPKNTTDDAEDHAKEKKSESKLDYSVDADGEKKEKKSKNKDDDSEEKKSKSKSEDDDDDEKKDKKSKSKSDDYTDDTEKKVKDKDKDEDDDEKKEKKSKSKEDDSEEKKEKKSKEKNKDEDFDAVPIETKADESMPAADTPDGYATPAKKTPPRLPAAANGYQAPTTTMSAADTPDGFLPPKIAAADTPDGYAAPTTMSAADTPDGYVTPSKAKPAMSATDSPDGYVTPSKAKPAMSATDSPDGYVTPSKAKPAMSASDSPDGYVPATDSPDGNVPASGSPDGYAVPFKKPKLDVQSFEEMVPRPVLDMLSPVVKSLCAKTRFPYTCEMSIAKLPETTVVPARQKDGLGVLNLAIDAVRAKIMEATKVAKDMTADPRVDQITKSAIKDCITLYDDVKTSYDTGLAALKRGDKSTATTAFDSARTYVDTCDNGFLDRPALKPVIAGQEKILAELSSNVLAINKYM